VAMGAHDRITDGPRVWTPGECVPAGMWAGSVKIG
jgi:hypothetical protein